MKAKQCNIAKNSYDFNPLKVKKSCNVDQIEKICESRINDKNFRLLYFDTCLDNVTSIEMKKKLPDILALKIPDMKNLRSIYLNYPSKWMNIIPNLAFQKYILKRLPKNLESISLKNLNLGNKIKIDSNDDSPKLKNIHIENCNIKQIGFGDKIKPNISILKLKLNKIENLDVSDLPKLKILNVNENKLQKLDLPSSLESLFANKNKLSQISLPSSNENGGLPGLKEIDLSYNLLQNIENLEKQSNLNQINLSYNQLSEISIPNNVVISNLSHNNLKNISINKDAKTEILEISYNNLNEISLPSKLKELYIDHNNLSKLAFTNDLTRLSASYNELLSIDLKSINHANISHNKIEKLNLTEHIKWLNASHNDISKVECHDCDLEYLNLSSNKLEDLSNLNAKYIDLSSNEIDLLKLSKFEKTETLIANNNEIYKIDATNLPKSLRKLSVKNNSLRKIPKELLSNKKIEINYEKNNIKE